MNISASYVQELHWYLLVQFDAIGQLDEYSLAYKYAK